MGYQKGIKANLKYSKCQQSGAKINKKIECNICPMNMQLDLIC